MSLNTPHSQAFSVCVGVWGAKMCCKKDKSALWLVQVTCSHKEALWSWGQFESVCSQDVLMHYLNWSAAEQPVLSSVLWLPYMAVFWLDGFLVVKGFHRGLWLIQILYLRLHSTFFISGFSLFFLGVYRCKSPAYAFVLLKKKYTPFVSVWLCM